MPGLVAVTIAITAPGALLGGCAVGSGAKCGDGICDSGETSLNCPQDCSLKVCGNGVREDGEQCDLQDLAGLTCQSQGFSGGVLACSFTCTLDTTGCVSDTCGNGARDDNEECDGANLGGESCEGLGFSSGTLACSPSCTYDTSGCETAPTCGNGQIDVGEQCDGANLGGESCQTQGFTSGTLGCTTGCQLDTSQCTAAFCGDGNIDAGEECDGANLGSQTCADHGFADGTLACDAGCQFDTSGCVNTQCVLTEGFESGMMPPTGWEKIDTNTSQNWKLGTYDPYSGVYNAEVEFDDLLGWQDEVLISPEIVCSSMTITFWANGSYHWAVEQGNYDVALWVVVGAWGGGDDYLITNTILGDLGVFTNWIWYPVSYPIPSQFDNQPIRIGWQYHGSDGAAFYLDDTQLL